MTSATVTFAAPPPGLAPHVDFDLTEVDGADGLFALRASGDESLRLFLVDAETYAPQYSPVIREEQLLEAGLTSGDASQVLLVTWFTTDGPAVNLQAPVVVDHEASRAVQLILDEELPVRHPLTSLTSL